MAVNIPFGLSYNDVLLIPQLSPLKSRSQVDLSTNITQDIKLKIPLISCNMDTVTGVEMAVAISKLGGIGFIGRFDPPEVQANKIADIKSQGGYSIGVIGIKDDYIKRAKMLLQAGSIALHLDVAHAHSIHVIEAIKNIKHRFPKISIIAGTVATYQGAYDLYKAGADCIKVGIGAASICITRVMTGCGVPQITAITEAARASKKFKNKYLIADAGAANSGDIVKALAAGAAAYEGGSIFAGCDESPGELIEKNGILYKQYNGSTSVSEKQRQLKKDRKNKQKHFILHVEGVEAMVKYQGNLEQVVAKLCAGIRSGFSYCGATDILELHKKARFIQISSAGVRESYSHDVITV